MISKHVHTHSPTLSMISLVQHSVSNNKPGSYNMRQATLLTLPLASQHGSHSEFSCQRVLTVNWVTHCPLLVSRPCAVMP